MATWRGWLRTEWALFIAPDFNTPFRLCKGIFTTLLHISTIPFSWVLGSEACPTRKRKRHFHVIRTSEDILFHQIWVCNLKKKVSDVLGHSIHLHKWELIREPCYFGEFPPLTIKLWVFQTLQSPLLFFDFDVEKGRFTPQNDIIKHRAEVRVTVIN